MITIQGKSDSIICFAKTLEESAGHDLNLLSDEPMLKGRNIRIMPDVHSNGNGTVTGFTMIHTEPVILKLEYGSGCGVAWAAVFNEHQNPNGEMLARLDEICHEIPAGDDTYLEPAFSFDFTRLHCYEALKDLYDNPVVLGSLGGGNHFIELDIDDQGMLFLVVHNGLGALSYPAVCHYRRIACSASGKSWQEASFEDTCLYGEDMEHFLFDMKIFEEVCRENRNYMIDYICGRMGWKITEYHDLCHHYIDENDGIIRHGAIPARKGEPVLIPSNAEEGCILGTGKGNPEWNCSAPHGGGRLLSRSQALRTLTMEQYRTSMKNVYTTTVTSENLDEAPAAYKRMEDIISAISDTVSVDKILRPVYNYKG